MSEKPEHNFDFSKSEDAEKINSAPQDKGEESVNQKINKRDVSHEARIRAEKAILESLDLDSDASLDNFQEKLMAAIESLAQYQELEQKLADVPPEALPYELFKTFQRSADSPDSYDQEKKSREDGVLVEQIKQGSPLMCAGRVMIASTFLQKHGIEHSVISTTEGDKKEASGHSAMLLNIGEDKLTYFDAQNNLYFTFPKSTLRGYEGSEKTSECVLEEYTPDQNDTIDGLNSINTKFITLPPSDGIASQYLNNVSAVLGGNKEFAHSGIVPDSEAKEAVDQIKNELIGENIILEKYDQRREETINQFKTLIKKNKQTALLALEKFPKKEDFIAAFSSILRDNNEMAEIYPYLKNASKDVRRQSAEKIWDICKKIKNTPVKNSINSEKEKSEKENPSGDLLEIYRVKDEGDFNKLSRVIDQAQADLSKIATAIGDNRFKKNLDWLLNNNNRIDLYHIAAVVNGEPYDRADDEMDINKARQLLSYRKIQSALLIAGETAYPGNSKLLTDFIERNLAVPHLCNTAVESLAKSSIPEIKEKLFEIVDNPKYGFEVRTRAVLAGLREKMQFENMNVVALLNEYVESLGDDLCQSTDTYNIIEIAGLLANNDARAILDDLQEKMRMLPPEKTQWFMRDIISTRLSFAADDKNEYLKKTLGERQYTSSEGIVFGAIDPNFDFQEFLARHKNKFDKVAEVVARINSAFGTEPIMYVDISTGDANEAGWTQNSIYFSRDYIEHSDNVDDLTQSAGHEACERWQSKGFIDAQLAEYYLQLMGRQYVGSELDKFRLKHRLSEGTNAGHPWDGEREFIAELGSALLVDPEKIKKLFDPGIDKTSMEALEYLKKKLHYLQKADNASEEKISE